MVSEYNIRLNPNCAAVVNTGLKFKSGDKGIILRIAVEELDTTGTTAKIVFWRANGTSVESDITGNDGVYSYKTLGNEFAVPGKTIADVKIYFGDDRVSTASFVFEVGVDTMDGLGAGTGGYSDRLEQLVSEAEEAGAMTERAKVDLQSATANLNATEKDMEATVQNFKDAYGEVGALKPRGNWSSGTLYQIRDMVYYNGFSWVCLVDNTGKEPSTANAAYWQQMTDLQSIISGTTTVGNASKLGGLTADGYLKRVPRGSTGESIKEVALDTSICPINKITKLRMNAPTDAPEQNSDFFIDVEKIDMNTWIVVTAKSIRTNNRYEIRLLSGTWTEWKNISDGGNADTVDGYHAGDLVKQHGSFLTSEQMNDSNWRDNYEGVTTNGTLVGLQSGWWYIKYFNNINADGFGAQIAIPLDGGQGYTPKYRLSVRTVWNVWKNFGDGVFLPLTGGTLSGLLLSKFGDIQLLSQDDNTKNRTRLLTYGGVTQLINVNKDYNVIRTLLINPPEFSADPKNALIYKYTADGVTVSNKILHTGNSAKVAIQSSAPSDTTALWVDTANKVIKTYIDGAWTQVS